jgi:REP element-mobilizing transposase RayT
MACEKTDWRIHAYCLMSNHFHIVPETLRPNLVAGMKWLLGTYSIRFNRRYDLNGHLFGGRYKAQLIDETKPEYLRIAVDYVHLNPSRAGLIDISERLESYPWSSYPLYLRPAKARPSWLRVDRVLGEHGIQNDTLKGRREFSRRIETQRYDRNMRDCDLLLTGWRFGSEDFISRLADQVMVRTEEDHTRVVRQENDAEKAHRLITEKLSSVGWNRERLNREHKGHPVKVQLAQKLRNETTLSMKWIAAELSMGSWGYLNQLLRKTRRTKDR